MLANSPLEQFSVIVQFPLSIPLFGVDITISNAVIYQVLVLSVFNFFLYFTTKKSSFVPSRWQSVIELLYTFVGSLVRQQTGVNGVEYVPLFFTTFMFILISNLIGLMPFGFTMTSHILLTFTLALAFNIGFLLLGFQKQGISFLKLFVPKGVPLLFKPLIIVIEVVSYLIRTFSLSLRLFANMMAGHTLLHILASFCFVGGTAFSFVPWLLVFAVVLLEFAIAFIQAYVFVILLTIYLNDSINGH
jgi:ATP synthase subunit 6